MKISKISKLGFGCWGLGGDSYGYISSKRSIELVNYAFNNKINFFDTSNVYGNGLSEKRLGLAFKNKNRSSFFVATKMGSMPHSPLIKKMPLNYDCDYLKKSFTSSLENLNLKFIDLIQLHSPPVEILKNKKKMEDIISMLKDFKKKQMVRYFGVSVKSPDDAKIVMKNYPDFKFIQINFNLMDQRAIDKGIIHIAKKKKIKIISRTPFAFGFLAQKVNLKNKDHRRRWPKKQTNLWNNGRKIFEKCILRDKVTISNIALLFSIYFNNIVTTIPGMMTISQINDNLNAMSQTRLSKNEFLRIRNSYSKINWKL